MTLHVAVVGLGGIGNRHCQVYTDHPQAEIVAVCDILRDRADKAAERWNTRAFYSVQEMLDAGLQIDAASVCSAGVENGGDHYKPTMELLGAGIPVLGEKPISNRIHEAATVYVLWFIPENAPATKAGTLVYDPNSRKGHLEATTAVSRFEVLLTAERVNTVGGPSEHVIARKKVVLE